MVFDFLAFLEFVIHGMGRRAGAVVSSLGCGCSEGLDSSDEWFEVLSLKRTHGGNTAGCGVGFYLLSGVL